MDVEKAREQLQDAAEILRANISYTLPFVYDDVQGRIEAALRALDGDGAEEWEARTQDGDRFRIVDGWPIVARGGYGKAIAICEDKSTARRIARLPALERAAEHAVRFLERSGGADPASEHETVREALYAALKQEGQ